MDDSPERRAPPNAGSLPGGYLPRLRRAESEPDSGSEPEAKETARKASAGAPQKKGKRKKKGTSKPKTDDKPKGVLLEETPAIDTIEVRQTVRLVAGSTAAVLFLIVGFVVFRVFTAKPVKVESSDAEKIEYVDPVQVKLQSETEAETLLERGREAARRGNQALAIKVLSRVSNAYPQTQAADTARQALTRPGQRLPLFPDSAGEPAESAAGVATPASIDRPGGADTEAIARGSPVVPTAAVANPEASLAAASPAATNRTESNAAIAPVDVPPPRSLPGGFQARSGVGVDPSGWPLEIISSRDSAMMVLVPGGPFLMGTDGADAAEAPAHPVKVSTFYIDKHEVTNRQFEMFIRETGPRSERNQALARDKGRVSVSEDFPVVMVSAKDARAYADWAGKRLPTEAQWEKAARGTDQRPYPWGVEAPAWVKPRAPLQVDAVMSFPSDLSPYGAYDLAGNVVEWTRDWYDPNVYASHRGEPVEDPTGPSSRPPSVQVAVRGSSRQWRITAREGLLDGFRLPYLGFRCVLPVEGPDSIFRPGAGLDGASPAAGPGGATKKAPVPF